MKLLSWSFLCFLFASALISPAEAQITIDGSTNTTLTPTDNGVRIDDGSRAGDNLFHSFGEFSVPTGSEAFFNNASDIVNIFSRVTGGNISNIDGLIRANGAANLFLINPQGIIFGNNASLQIGGSFYGSTADSILFPDGIEFRATNTQRPILTINAPIGLNFRDNPRSIVNRSFAINSAGDDFVGLEVAPGNNLSLVGGNINFEAGQATAFGGNIQLGGLSDAGTVTLNNDGSLSFPEDVAKADIILSNFSDIDVTGTGGGSITINGRNVSLSAGDFGSSFIRAGITADSTSAGAASGDITIDATDNVIVDESFISNAVESFAVGNAGVVSIDTTNLTLTNGGQIGSNIFGEGNGGTVTINAKDTISVDRESGLGFGSLISSSVQPNAVGNAGTVRIDTLHLSLTNGGQIQSAIFGEGNGGTVTINAKELISVDGENSNGFPSGIASNIESNAIGDAGEVSIETTNLTLTNGGQIGSNILGSGNGGTVTINAKELISVDGEGRNGFSSTIGSILGIGAAGNAGEVSIESTNLILTNGGQISSSIFGEGKGGTVIINAKELISVDGEGRNGLSSGITSNIVPIAIGKAGEVRVQTTNLTLTNGGQIGSNTFGEGDAGIVRVNAKELISVDGEARNGFFSGIASIVGIGAVGKAGEVKVQTTNLTLTNGGQIGSNTLGEGDAGIVRVNAKELISVDGEARNGLSSAIASIVGEDAIGDGGEVSIETTNLILSNGGQISSNTLGEGNAGIVTVNAKELISVDGEARNGLSSAIVSRVETEAIGNAGEVNIETTNLILSNEGRIGSSNLNQGEAGNVNIEANSVRLENGLITANTASGTRGNIFLQVTETLTLQQNSLITAEARGDASGGNIDIGAEFIIAFPSNGDGNDIIANAEQGDAGNIDITAEALLGIEQRQAIPGNRTNDIDASSQFGLDGDITFNVPDTNNFQETAELSSNVVSAEVVAGDACSSHATASQFVILGKGGVPPAPNLPLTAEALLGDGKPITPNNSGLNNPQTSQNNTFQVQPIKTSVGDIYPARGIIKTEDGRVILTAYPTSNNATRTPSNTANCHQIQ